MDLTCSLENVRLLPHEGSTARTWRRWWVPDLALFVSLVTLVFCLFLFDGFTQLFRDSDSGWHIRTGETILHSGALPRKDPYSLLRSGSTWFAWEWGADLLMGAAHRAAGLAGVALMYSVAIAACSWMWFRLQWAVGGSFLLAALLAALMLTTTNMHWLARPHVLSWLGFLGFVWWAEALKNFSVRTGISFFLAGALWANLHASFLFGPLILLVYAVGSWLRVLIWDVDPAHRSAGSGVYVRAACCCAAGSLLNPYGWELHRHIVAYLTNSELLDRIGEFQSFNFHADGSTQILLTLAVSASGAVLALGHRRLEHFLLAGLFLAMGLRSARALPLVGLVLLPLANAAVTRGLRGAPGLRPKLRIALDAALNYSANLRVLDTRCGGFALVPIVILALVALIQFPVLSTRAGFPADQFPVAAAEVLEKLPLDIRLLAPDKFGGYLIYRFNGSRKVYFDGRSDFYGSSYMKEYLNLIEVRPGWREQLEQIGFTHALLPNRYSLIPALQNIGWKEIYKDGVATLLANENAVNRTERR
jgi:hypothetical protein